MRRSLPFGLLLAACLFLGALTTGCTKDDVDPTTGRRDRVETRLRSTFSAAQARCVLARLDGRTLAALDRNRNLQPSSAEFARYSRAVRTCVVPDATTPTEAVPGGTTVPSATAP